MALVNAFFFSGRAKVISRTLPACLILMCSVICKLHRAIQVTVSNNVRHDDLTRSSCHLDCRHRLLIEESNEATANQSFRVGHDSVNQLGDGRSLAFLSLTVRTLWSLDGFSL